MRRLLVAWIGIVVLFPQFTHAQESEHPRNCTFELGEVGSAPLDWEVAPPTAKAGYVITVADEGAHEGQRCLSFDGTGVRTRLPAPAVVQQSILAAPYRGKIVRLRVAARAQARSKARAFLRVNRVSGKAGFYDGMTNRPVTSEGWQELEIVGHVADDADEIVLGLRMDGSGAAWFDEVTFEVLGSADVHHEEPRPLSDRGLANTVAFAKLFGYVRYFHPSDEAFATDWDDLAIRGVRAVERATSPERLALLLRKIFGPIAPTLEIFADGNDSPTSSLRPPADAPPRIVAWEHRGLGVLPNDRRYISKRVRTGEPKDPDNFGYITQSVNARPMRGHRVQFRARVRTETFGEGYVGLWLRVDRENREYVYKDMSDQPIADPHWRTYEIEADVPEDAINVSIGILSSQEGAVWVDDTALEIAGGDSNTDDPSEVDSSLRNPGFELGQDWGKPSGWHFLGEDTGFECALSETDPTQGARCLRFAYVGVPEESLPNPQEPFESSLGGGVSFRMPLALYLSGDLTVPQATQPVTVPPMPSEFFPTAGDRSTRLAGVVIAWNVFQHFYPYFDVVDVDWPEVLRRALNTAATDRDEEEYWRTLKRLVAALDDAHGNVSFGHWDLKRRIPILWEWIEDELVVTHSEDNRPSGIRRGDLVVSVNGQPAREALLAEEELISGATPQWKRYRALAALANGVEGDTMTLVVRRGQAQLETTLTYELPNSGDDKLTRPLPPQVTELRPGIHYLDLDRVSDGDFRSALPKLLEAKGIIFDVRGYPKVSTVPIAHLIDEPVSSARWQIPLARRPNQEGRTFEVSNWEVAPRAPRITAPVIFLTSGRAMSYAETFMAIIEHYALGEIVGSATAGTNGNTTHFLVPGGYRISWTGMRVLKHDGSTHHGVGIQPTVRCSRTIRGVQEGRDEVLERAIGLLSGES